MSLTTKALDRLIARVVDRVADRVVFPISPLNPADLDAALARAMDRAAKDRLGKILDDGGFDHRINDTIDCEVEKALKAVDLCDMAKERLDDIIEDRIDASGFARQLDRALERIDLEQMAEEKIDGLDVEGYLKEAAQETCDREADSVLREVAGEKFDATIVRRYDARDAQDAMDRAAAEAISAAVCQIVDNVNATLEAQP